MRPIFLIQQSSPARIQALRKGLGDIDNVVAIGMDHAAFARLSGLDAIYMGLTRAEGFGSAPLRPHVAGLLPTNPDARAQGFPDYILTGLVLLDDEPNTAEVCLPLIMQAILAVSTEANQRRAGSIRTIGLMEPELTFRGATPEVVGRLIALSLRG